MVPDLRSDYREPDTGHPQGGARLTARTFSLRAISTAIPRSGRRQSRPS